MIRTKPSTPPYREGWDRVFQKKTKRAEKLELDAQVKRGLAAARKFCWNCGSRHFLEDDCAS